MLYAAVIAILITMGLALVRVFMGPTAYDRMLATNLLGTKVVLFIVVAGHALGWQGYTDIALLYALINFVGIIATMRFFEYPSTIHQDEP